jgi:hypothetical protein
VHEDLWISTLQAAISLCLAYAVREEGRMKNFPAKIPRNPLISPDSDERIQGNPRKSNRSKQRFPEEKGRSPRKTKLPGFFTLWINNSSSM